jgi:hypothetical protein
MQGTRGGNTPLQHVAEIARAASLLVSCVVCEKLHKPECPLGLNPIRAACTGRYTMALLHMGGCYPLTEEKIDEEVTRTEPGNYALGYPDCGEVVNQDIPIRRCTEAEHAEKRRNRCVYCVNCGKQLIQGR